MLKNINIQMRCTRLLVIKAPVDALDSDCSLLVVDKDLHLNLCYLALKLKRVLQRVYQFDLRDKADNLFPELRSRTRTIYSSVEIECVISNLFIISELL